MQGPALNQMLGCPTYMPSYEDRAHHNALMLSYKEAMPSSHLISHSHGCPAISYYWNWVDDCRREVNCARKLLVFQGQSPLLNSS